MYPQSNALIRKPLSFNSVSGNDSGGASSLAVTKRPKPSMPPHVAFVDLRTHYDDVLMTRFYDEMMIPNFPDPDELDSLEYMKQMVLTARDEEDATYKEPSNIDYHVTVMVSFPEPYDPKKTYDFSKAGFKGEFMGAVVYEYYIQANAGLLTYLLVNPRWRGLNLGTILSDKCREVLESHAKSRGHLAGCNAIFLETNSATKLSNDHKDVMEPAKRHQIFYNMGLRLVDFDYVQPPLDKDKNKVNYLLLCCFITPRIPSITVGDKEQYYLPTNLVKNTMYAFWVNAPIKGRKFNEDVDYKRMQDQLRRREQIMLLDLPWERPFTIVDLAEHFDLELLVQFYNDLLLPCYKGRQEELDSFERWLELLSPKQVSAQDDGVVFHLLLALKYSDDEEENSKPMIAGGLSFEYFPGNNCGFLTYLLAPMGATGERMARALIDRALGELDNDAKTRGQLGGCNVIFMECSQAGASATPTPVPSTKEISGPVASPELTTEVRDIEEQHPLLESMGWKMVDFDYVQPPNRDPAKKVKSMLLIALVTPRIPVLSQEGRSHHYIPGSTLKKFLVDLWDEFCDRLSYDYTKDADFLTMMDHLDRRPRIPLGGRPWNKPWTMTDLQEHHNPQLLAQFYEDILKPAFASHPEDLEAIEEWQNRLTKAKVGSMENFHVLLALKPTIEDFASKPATILGGMAFNYYEGTNCGFITHVLIRDLSNKEMVAKSLMERAVEILDQDAVVRGSLAGCNAIFLETLESDATSNLSSSISSSSSSSVALISSSSASSSSASSSHSPASSSSSSSTISSTDLVVHSDQLDISSHHHMLHRLGWRLVDFTWVSPHRKASRKPHVHKSLAMFLTRRVPRAEVLTSEEVYYYLPRHTLSGFINEYWRISTVHSPTDYKKDTHFKNMMDLLTRRERIPLLDLPWTRPWTLVDLWEDFDAQLLYKFYQNYVASYPDKADREPLSTWLQLLAEESRDTPNVEDFHVLLALQYPILSGTTTSTKTTTTNILGGLLATYYISISCGLITYLTVPSHQDLLSKSLIDEATINLNENATHRGHIAGCNAIFMEIPLVRLAKSSRPDHETLFRGGWRLLNFEYYRPPLSIFSAGGTRFLLLVLLTPNIPREVNSTAKGGYTYYMPSEMLKNFLWQHWRNTYHRVGRTLVARDPNYQKMLQSLEGVEQVPLIDLPWTPPTTPKL